MPLDFCGNWIELHMVKQQVLARNHTAYFSIAYTSSPTSVV
jgi:hypothetical protein